MKKVNILISVGIILIFIGMCLELDKLIKDNEKKQELIDIQAEQIIQCNEEENTLYREYLKLEEENMVCWDMYYSGVSEYDGEYEYHE